MRRLASLVVAAALAARLAGCGAGAGQDPAERSPSTEDTSTRRPARFALSFVVEDAAGTDVLTVDLAADGSGRVQGDLGGTVDLSAGPSRDGKRSWRSQGQPLGDVKLEPTGKLKLKDPAGTTLWGIQPNKPDSTKVLEGEDVTAYTLRTTPGSDAEAKVKQGEEEVGAVKGRSSGGSKVERPDGTTVFQTDQPPASGLGFLLMDRIPAPQRAVLLVERVDRARP